MDIFDNCRICLETINHEPIKMTRLILKFIEVGLNLKSVGRHFEPKNVKQNLCAVCFNKLADFQDFHEQCKESDQFWQAQFESDKQNKLEKCMQDIKDDDDAQHIEEDVTTKVPEAAPEENQEYDEAQQPDEFMSSASSQPEVDTSLCPAAHTPSDITEPLSLETYDNEHVEACADLDEWPDNNEEETEEEQENISQPQSDVNQEIIEFEYELEHGNVESVELSQPEVPTSTVIEGESQADNMNYEFADVEDSASCDTLIHETYEDVLDNEQTAQAQYGEVVVENSFLEMTTIDDNGKAKKSYQCQHCGKYCCDVCI